MMPRTTPAKRMLEALSRYKAPFPPDTYAFGAATMSILISADAPAEAFLTCLYVPPDKRRAGEATRAIQAVAEEALRNGVTLTLSVVPLRDRAVCRRDLKAFYFRLGFRGSYDRMMLLPGALRDRPVIVKENMDEHYLGPKRSL